jgi:hypothetical protein
MHVLSITQIQQVLQVGMYEWKGINAAFITAIDPKGMANYLDGFTIS